MPATPFLAVCFPNMKHSYGEALTFLKNSTDYSFLEIDTRYEENFKKVLSLVDSDALFISNTNVEFSTFLIENTLKVLIVDTLYWMWNDVPKQYAEHPYFIAQSYYGDNIANLPTQKICKPIIDYKLWEDQIAPTSDDVLISFGGMAEPGDHTYFIEYANWMVKKIADIIPNNLKNIHVVGGLFSVENEKYHDKNIHYLGALSPLEYSYLVRKCKYLFVSPGLTSLYELLVNKHSFCLLPGLNVSQVYQVYHYNKENPCSNSILWPDVEKLIYNFNILPELEGINYLEHYLNKELDKDAVDFVNPARVYFESLERGKGFVEKTVYKQIFNHPGINELVLYYLGRMEEE